MGNSKRLLWQNLSAFKFGKKKKITVDAGLTDAEYREIVEMLIINHFEAAFTVRVGDRVAQIVFVKRIDADFRKVEKKDLSKTKRGEGGFGSTGISEN